MLAAKQSGLLTFKLDHDYGWDDGLICGGTMNIFVETLATPAAAQQYDQALQTLRQGAKPTVKLSFDAAPGASHTYEEVLEPAPRLIIAGAGHVGQALARLASDAGFDVTIVDDRADLTSPERFPFARHRVVGEIELELRRQSINQDTFIVIVTRGHRHDGRALAAVIDSPARYIGLIGSRRKVITIFQDLLRQGVSMENLLRVHAPIGVEIGAVTVPEIALSIAAELVAVRRGLGGKPALPMKFDADALRKHLEEQNG
jgi:xanthine dehydrogenase accessory factor